MVTANITLALVYFQYALHSCLGIAAIGHINKAIDEGNPTRTVEELMVPTAKLQGVKGAYAWHYQDVLMNAKTLKCQV